MEIKQKKLFTAVNSTAATQVGVSPLPDIYNPLRVANMSYVFPEPERLTYFSEGHRPDASPGYETDSVLAM